VAQQEGNGSDLERVIKSLTSGTPRKENGRPKLCRRGDSEKEALAGIAHSFKNPTSSQEHISSSHSKEGPPDSPSLKIAEGWSQEKTGENPCLSFSKKGLREFPIY